MPRVSTLALALPAVPATGLATPVLARGGPLRKRRIRVLDWSVKNRSPSGPLMICHGSPSASKKRQLPALSTRAMFLESLPVT